MYSLAGSIHVQTVYMHTEEGRQNGDKKQNIFHT
jgi:hypothetical protein